jgi:hypothetical protein
MFSDKLPIEPINNLMPTRAIDLNKNYLASNQLVYSI